MNNRIMILVMLLVGVVIGVGVGVVIMKNKVNEQVGTVEEQKAEISRLQNEQKIFEDAVRKAKTETGSAKNEVIRMKNFLNDTVAKLAQANAELREIRARNPEAPAVSLDTTGPEVVITTPSGPGGTVSTMRTLDYVIKKGDSFWKIAEEQLGNGLRYKEILKLNPAMSENQTLVPGTTMKLPSQ